MLRASHASFALWFWHTCLHTFFSVVHVTGHSDDPRNELADTVATLAALELVSNKPPEFLQSLMREHFRSTSWAWLEALLEAERAQFPSRSGDKIVLISQARTFPPLAAQVGWLLDLAPASFSADAAGPPRVSSEAILHI